jgi:hypothetical protein
VIVALETIHGILRTLLLVSVMGDLSARRVSTLWPDGFSRRRFFDLTLREIFSPSRLLVCDFAEINATRLDESWRAKMFCRRHFSGSLLREILSPSRAFFCDPAESLATKDTQKKGRRRPPQAPSTTFVVGLSE